MTFILKKDTGETDDTLFSCVTIIGTTILSVKGKNYSPNSLAHFLSISRIGR